MSNYILKFADSYKSSTKRFVDLSALLRRKDFSCNLSCNATVFPDKELALFFAKCLRMLYGVKLTPCKVGRDRLLSFKRIPIHDGLPDSDTMYTFNQLGLRVFVSRICYSVGPRFADGRYCHYDTTVLRASYLCDHDNTFVTLFEAYAPDIMSFNQVKCDFFEPLCEKLSHLNFLACIKQADIDFDDSGDYVSNFVPD